MKNLKRIVSLLLVIAMLAAMPVVASAAGYDHVHVFAKDASKSKTADCTVEGYDYFACTQKGCTAYYTTNIVPATHTVPVFGTTGNTVKGVAVEKDGVLVNWKIVCNKCGNTLQTLPVTDCDTAWSSFTVVETDSNGNTKTDVDGVVTYAGFTGISEKQFASGASTFFKKVETDTDGHTRTTNADNTETYSLTKEGFASGAIVSTTVQETVKETMKYVVGGVNYYKTTVKVDGVLQESQTEYKKETVDIGNDVFAAEVGATTPTPHASTTTKVTTEVDGNGNKKIATKIDSNPETYAYEHADGTPATGAEFRTGVINDTLTVTTYVDEKGNKKITTGGTVTYEDAGGNPIDEKGFASGTAAVTSKTHSGTASFVSDPAKHGTLTTTIVRGKDCRSNQLEYSYQTCATCGLKMGSITGTAAANENAKTHNYPTTGDYVVGGVKYTTVQAATSTADGYAQRVCATCNRIEMVIIPKGETSYYSATTKNLTAVYCKDNQGDVQTVGDLKIGNLPAGATVLVLEKRGAFAKIDAKNSTGIGSAADGCWVLQSDLNISSAPTAKNTCAHGTKEVIYESLATCQFKKMQTEQCKACKLDYEFKVSGSKLSHKDTVGNDWETTIDKETFKIENDKAWVITKQPTETEVGEMKRVCKTCGYTELATGATSDSSKKYKFTDIKILRATGIQHEKAYVNVAAAEVFDKYIEEPKLTFYAVKGSNVTILGYSVDKTWVNVEGDTGNRGWTKASNLKIGASSAIDAVYQGATHYGIVDSGAQMKVRLSYAETSDVVSTLTAGSAIAVYETKVVSGGVWGRIESKTANKWVKLGDGTDIDSLTSLNGLKTLKKLLCVYADASPVAKLDEPIAEGHVTSTIGLSVRKSASVSSARVDELPAGAKAFIYEIKTVNGVEWAKVKTIKAKSADPDNGVAEYGVKVTKADLETVAKEDYADGWICMTYFALDTEIGTSNNQGASASYSGVVTTGGIMLNVRKAADVYADKVGALANGTKVTVYETANAKNNVQWGRISQDKIDGWVCMQYVTLDTPATAAGGAASAVKPNASVANCATAVNVRNKSDISGTQVGRIPVGTRIAVTKLENGWGYVDSKGWVYLQYVALDAGAEEAIKNGAATPAVGSNEAPITKYTAVTVSATVLNDTPVYKNVGDTTEKLMTIVATDEIKVLDRAIVSGNLWYKISEGSVTGWINQSANIRINAISGTVEATSNVYEDHSVDSGIKSVLGAGSKVYIEEGNANHYTEGIYAWGHLSTGGWIMLSKLTLDAVADANFTPAITTTPTITGTTLKPVTIYKNHVTSSDTLVILEKDTSVTVLDWYYDKTGKATWGKVTQGQYTGWIVMQDATDIFVEQNSVSGTVTGEILNLYKNPGDTDVELVLRQGDTVTVTERRLIGNAIWGRMVAAKDTQKRQLWANLAGTTLAGQIVTPEPTPAPTPTPVTPTTVTIGIVTGADEVNVRSDPHATSPLLTKLKKGTQVKVSQQITSDGAAWAKIEQGWMAMQYINLQAGTVVNSDGSATVTGTTIMTTVPTGAIAAGFTSIENLAVRSSAGVGMPQVKTLAKGSSVVIKAITQANGLYWGQTDEGWICMSYVTVTAVGSTNAGTAGTIGRCFYTVNVRSAAGVANAITAKIMVSANVRIYETTVVSGETWGRTDLGWVSMQYVVS